MFYNCGKLKHITVKGDLLKVGNDVFTGCDLEIYYPDGNDTWENKRVDIEEDNVRLSGI